MSDYAAQREHLTSVDGIDGYWAQKSGGDIESEPTKVHDGGKLRPDSITNPSEFGQITLQRPYKRVRDREMLAALRPQVGRYRASITVQDTRDRLEPDGEPVVYPDALLVGITEPERDASSGEPQMVELTFDVNDAA